MFEPLFKPLDMGALRLPNRVLMAPLTRNRAEPDGTPREMAADYYRQRAGAGLIVSEATQISPEGKGYKDTPGIHSDTHVRAWRRITDAVHREGGRIFLQLWHVGRISHVSLQPNGQQPVAPSAIRANTQTFTENGFEEVSEPRALRLDEMPRIVADFAAAARRAKEAGFDGVEVHAANGYLLDQFIRDGANKRDDAYGGPPENRIRLPLEVVEAVAEVWGADRVGIRFTPTQNVNDLTDSDPETVFGLLLDRLSETDLAYVHFVEQFQGQEQNDDERRILKALRRRWNGAFIGNGGYDGESAAQAVASGHADAIAFGRPFIANPDLPERLRLGAALNEPDPNTFYGGGREGYTDYPFLDRAA